MASLQQRLTELFGHVFTEDIASLVPTIAKQIPRELVQPLIVSMCLGFAQYWMTSTENYTPEFFAKGILHIIVNGPAKAAGLLPGDMLDIEQLIQKS